MSDRGNQPGGGPPEPLSDLEDQEHRRKKLAEEARKEQEHRASGAPGAVDEDVLTADHDWTPPPEMSQMEPGRKAIWRVLGFFLFLFVGYFLVRWTTQLLFTPRLAAGSVSVPTDIVSPDEAI